MPAPGFIQVNSTTSFASVRNDRLGESYFRYDTAKTIRTIQVGESPISLKRQRNIIPHMCESRRACPGHLHRMFADWDCIVRNLLRVADDRLKPGHDGGRGREPVVSVPGITLSAVVRRNARLALCCRCLGGC